jgi:hypothetical protein
VRFNAFLSGLIMGWMVNDPMTWWQKLFAWVVIVAIWELADVMHESLSAKESK